MSTCHQAHNIPWNTFLELLEKVPSTRAYEMLEGKAVHDSFELVFTPDEKGDVFRKVKFFAAKVDSAIKEFSKTERAKHLDKDIDKLSELYGKESCNEWLEEGPLQTVSGWDWESGSKNQSVCQYRYLDSLKEFFIQEKVASLLSLARKGFPIEKLEFVTYSNFFHYGLGRIKEDCLTLYIHLNLLLANGNLRKPEQWHMQWRRFLLKEIMNSYDGNRMHSHMYREYFEKNPNFEDLEELQELLKKLFRTLYIYDMIFAERGVNISWEEEVLKCIGSYFVETSRRSYQFWYQQIDRMMHEKSK